MYKEIGKKIKALAQIICVIGIGISIIIGILLMVRDDDMIFAGILILLLGSLLSWIGSFMTYGFGELIDKTCQISKNLCKKATGVEQAKSERFREIEELYKTGLITEKEYNQLILR